MSFASTVMFLGLFGFALASETIESNSCNCQVKGAPGAFSYDSTKENGPYAWGDIAENFAMCKTGSSQSPIDFPSTMKYAPLSEGPMPNIHMANMTFGATSYNWALNCDHPKTCGSTQFSGKTYYIANIHFHSPSEHRLNGKQYPLEAHMVHASEDGAFAVIATLFDYPPDDYASTVYNAAHKDYGTNSFISYIIQGLNDGKTEFVPKLGKIIDAPKGYCAYSGGLTTPPCSEGVTFFMALKVQTVSRRQVHAYHYTSGAGIEGNNRPVQPLNGREVTCYA